MKIWKVLILFVVFGALLLGVSYVYTLSKIELKSVNINSLQDISLSGFTLGGNIMLYNGGIMPVGINHISYEVQLEKYGTVLTEGYIQGEVISPGQTVSFPFSNKINWVPTAELAFSLIMPGETYATVSGTIYIADLKIIDFKVPFQARINLGEYIKQFAVQKISQAVDTTIDAVKQTSINVGNEIKSASNTFVNGIKKIFG